MSAIEKILVIDDSDETITIDPNTIGRISSKQKVRPDTRKKWWWFLLERHINRECVSFGFTINWNLKPSIEIDFLFWRFNIEWNKKKRKKWDDDVKA